MEVTFILFNQWRVVQSGLYLQSCLYWEVVFNKGFTAHQIILIHTDYRYCKIWEMDRFEFSCQHITTWIEHMYIWQPLSFNDGRKIIKAPPGIKHTQISTLGRTMDRSSVYHQLHAFLRRIFDTKHDSNLQWRRAIYCQSATESSWPMG